MCLAWMTCWGDTGAMQSGVDALSCQHGMMVFSPSRKIRGTIELGWSLMGKTPAAIPLGF